MKDLFILLTISLFGSMHGMAQKQDTLRISAKEINSAVLKEGTHRYLVYFKMGRDSSRSQTQFWTRNIVRTTQNNKSVLIVTQEWEFMDTVLHTVTSVCDGVTLQPITHEFWWKKRGTGAVNFVNGGTVSLNGAFLSDQDTSRYAKAIWSAFKSVNSTYFLNWHIDMEVFPTLPFKNGRTFIVPFYDPGTSAPFEEVLYTVTGSAQLTGYDNQKINCWLLEHTSKGNKEIFWISKKTKEVLKLEQEINGRFYRYKIKLGFSI
ncbi:hypothetical protein [Flavihumibacter sp. UBA7668]|uniref:DUF3108 domain-containing protein n=1 Tax=Flavihumibacter sp. UBA7668 TaxID=1946542 RepID=UPI0025BF6D19|nr:hypothetical protein [Flavihumibacter sp. UBA7668]